MYLIDVYKELMEKAKEAADKENYDEALTLYTKAIDCSLEISLSFFKRGEMYFYKGEYENSLIDLNKAISIDEDEPVYYFYRAFSKFNLDDIDGAKRDFFLSSAMRFKPAIDALKEYIFPNAQALLDLENEEISKNPKNVSSYKIRASLNSEIDPLSSISDLTTALEIDPSQDEIFLTRGAIRRRIGQIEESFEDIKKFLEKYPNSIAGLANLGWLYLLIDEKEYAIETFKKCTSLKAKDNVDMSHQIEVLDFLNNEK